MMYEFDFRTGKIVIDHSICGECRTKACVKADSLYDRGILRITDGKPVLAISQDAAASGSCIECLACEIHCHLEGLGALKILLPIEGLEEFRRS